MTITLTLPSFDFRSAESTWVGLDKSLSNGRVIGFSYEDPTVGGNGKPLTVILNKDPKTGEPIDPPIRAYVYKPSTPFTSCVNHPDNLGPAGGRRGRGGGGGGRAGRGGGAGGAGGRAGGGGQAGRGGGARTGGGGGEGGGRAGHGA